MNKIFRSWISSQKILVAMSDAAPCVVLKLRTYLKAAAKEAFKHRYRPRCHDVTQSARICNLRRLNLEPFYQQFPSQFSPQCSHSGREHNQGQSSPDERQMDWVLCRDPDHDVHYLGVHVERSHFSFHIIQIWSQVWDCGTHDTPVQIVMNSWDHFRSMFYLHGPVRG